MSISIFEVLLNARYNLKSDMDLQRKMGMNQLDNAITCLSNDKTIEDIFDDDEFQKMEKFDFTGLE